MAQIANRVEESLTRPIEQPKKLTTKKSKDQAYLLEDGESCELVEVVEKEGKGLFHHPEPLLLDPCSSSKIGVYKYHRRNTIVKWIPTTEIWQRAIRVERGQNTTFVSVLHQV